MLRIGCTPVLAEQELFQWAPTLGGECYEVYVARNAVPVWTFQRAPTLGGECYFFDVFCFRATAADGFKGHPPLGVNATESATLFYRRAYSVFQWAPTLGGECYYTHHHNPNCTRRREFQWAPTLGGECYR